MVRAAGVETLEGITVSAVGGVACWVSGGTSPSGPPAVCDTASDCVLRVAATGPVRRRQLAARRPRRGGTSAARR